ncbi:MAG TPA: class I SAM-dependent methyltransferase [Flavobacterium sp.]|jgi:ubiquinone/menaquinone biosynthesis C-methylase UbiE
MKDYFSDVASDYASYRPHYPPEMIGYIVSFVDEKLKALDVATGNGQVAALLADHFKEVFATDISTAQLADAVQKVNIIYKCESAEETGFPNNTFDLITVAQAIHWFDFDKFYKEVYRILKPKGIFAILGYDLLSTNPETDKIIRHYYNNILGDYWHPERRYLDEQYTTIPFPFDEIPVKRFRNEFIWSFEQLEGYFGTWSAGQNYKKKNCSNPFDLVRDELLDSWERNDKKVAFPLLLRIGKLTSA